jgi:acetyltransferase-like isoleucine patch superfamily enzyme
MTSVSTPFRGLGHESAQRLISLAALTLGQRADRLQRALLRLRGVGVSGPVYIGSGTRLFGARRLSLGARVAIGENSHLVCHAPIAIGDDFLSAPGLYINSGGHDPATLRSFAKPVTIGRRVWCGARVTICAGVEVGDDVVIGAGAVVVKPIPARSIAAGVPARVIAPLDRKPGDFESWYRPRRT